MGRTLKEIIASLPKARRRAIKKRATALIAARKKKVPNLETRAAMEEARAMTRARFASAGR